MKANRCVRQISIVQIESVKFSQLTMTSFQSFPLICSSWRTQHTTHTTANVLPTITMGFLLSAFVYLASLLQPSHTRLWLFLTERNRIDSIWLANEKCSPFHPHSMAFNYTRWKCNSEQKKPKITIQMLKWRPLFNGNRNNNVKYEKFYFTYGQNLNKLNNNTKTYEHYFCQGCCSNWPFAK